MTERELIGEEEGDGGRDRGGGGEGGGEREKERERERERGAKEMRENTFLIVLLHTVGSIPESDGGKLYNTCMVFNPSGEMLGKYRKVRVSSLNF